MAVVQIIHQFDFAVNPASDWTVLLEPATQDIRLKILNVKINLVRDANGNGLLRWGRPEELPNESPENYAEKVWESEWIGEHYRLDLYMFRGSEEIIINSIPLVNRNFPYDRDLVNNTRSPGGYFDLQQGFGLKSKFVDHGFGLPQDLPDQFIAIFGTGQSGTDSFSTPQINVDASTSVTNTADGKMVKEGIIPTGNWELSGQETAVSQGYPKNWGHGDLLGLIDGDPESYWESQNKLGEAKIIVTIHFGKEYQINGLKIKTGDIPNMAKGTIFTSTDMMEWRSVGHSGFLEGDINFAKRAARWIKIETSKNINVGYKKWWLHGISVYGDITQENEKATNPIISAFSWLVKHIRYGNSANSLPTLTAAPIVEEANSDSYAKIQADSNSLPQLNYSPFMKSFDSEPAGLSKSQKMGQEYVGIQIDLGKNYDVELIDAHFSTTPKQWRGFLMGSKDYQTWITLASGFISELKNQAINFTQCRFFRLVNDPTGNHANGLSTPPILNEFSVYASLSMTQIDPIYPPQEPAAYLDTNNISLKTDDLTLGTLSRWGDYAHRGAILPTVVDSAGQKLIQFSGYNELYTTLAESRDFYGVTCVVKSPNPSWNNWGNVWSHNTPQPHSWSFAFKSGASALSNNPPLNRVRQNQSEITIASDLWSLVDVSQLFVLTVFWDTGLISHSPGELIVHQSNISEWECSMDMGDILVWGSIPSDAELVEVEDWMMVKYGIS